MSAEDEYEAFGDADPLDAICGGDEDVDWSKVDEVQAQIDAIADIEDDDERVDAAGRWSAELAGEG